MSNTFAINPAKHSVTSNGHAMTRIEVSNEIAKAEKAMRDEYKGYESSCGRCGSAFELSTKTYSRNDKIRLSIWLTKGNCPYCTMSLENHVRLQNSLVQHEFEVGNREIKCLRVPTGYRTKKIIHAVDDKGTMKVGYPSKS